MEEGKRYRLPTEQEWEYAARAGADGDIPWAQIRQQAQLDTRTTNAVGGKAPNAWGLYDMLGNVWEWVQDWYNEKLFANPEPPQQGTQHVLKKCHVHDACRRAGERMGCRFSRGAGGNAIICNFFKPSCAAKTAKPNSSLYS
jgi:formylglycine-generating enzyme required for sulfatase activity